MLLECVTYHPNHSSQSTRQNFFSPANFDELIDSTQTELYYFKTSMMQQFSTKNISSNCLTGRRAHSWFVSGANSSSHLWKMSGCGSIITPIAPSASYHFFSDTHLIWGAVTKKKKKSQLGPTFPDTQLFCTNGDLHRQSASRCGMCLLWE